MKVERLAISDVVLLTPARHRDARGFFSEVYQEARHVEAGVTARFTQDNHSVSGPVGTMRGLHCQIAPNVQGKLVRVLRGAIWDVAIDIRQGSPTYGQHVSATLSADNWQQLWIPHGFLHGFCTLEPDTEVLYKVDAPYDRAAERGVAWDDPTLALPWPVERDPASLSGKDRVLPPFAEAASWFPA